MEFRHELIRAAKDRRRLANLLATIAANCGDDLVAAQLLKAKAAIAVK